jgi:hypothetical protein
MSINFFAVLVATLVFYIFGAIYYTVVSDKWVASQETTKEKMFLNPHWGGKAAPFIISFVMIFLMNTVFAHIIKFSSPNGSLGIDRAALYGFGLWLGFCLPVSVTNNAYENRTKTLTFIDTMYFLVGLVVSGIILAAMR